MRNRNPLSIPDKANLILNLILVIFLLILLRVFSLAIFYHDETLDIIRQPRQRLVQETTKRGTIRDRFNQPLAMNKVRYQVTINYSDIRSIPSIVWERDGKRKIKRYKRKEYVKELSQMLGKELDLESERVEDLIHSKAALYFHIPFVLRDDIGEKEYYKLLMLEKDWPGIYVRAVPKRVYPMGPVASDLVGYMGPINRGEFEEVIGEMRNLRKFLRADEEGDTFLIPEGFESTKEIRRRLQELEKRAYTINDYVGKGGVEGYFEEELRGFQGEKKYYSDAQGNFIWEYPGGRPPMSGQRILLTISSELQEYAESLLATNEIIRAKETLPWILGGAAIVMDPNSGDILAMATYPRFDPNDFIHSGNPEINREKRDQVHHWLESEIYIADLWNQRRPLERERYDDLFEIDEQMLTWDDYLDIVLPKASPIKEQLATIETIGDAVQFLNSVDSLLEICESYDPKIVFEMLFEDDQEGYTSRQKEEVAALLKINRVEVEKIKKALNQTFGPVDKSYDQLLFVDLLRLNLDHNQFDPLLLQQVGHYELERYRNGSKAMVTLNEVVKSMTKELFHTNDFALWRESHEKAFLKEKRAEEKKEGKYSKPYIDYFDKQEKEMFTQFWEENRLSLIQSLLTGYSEKKNAYTEYFHIWNKELSAGAHMALPWRKQFFILKQAIQGKTAQIAKKYLATLRGYDDLTRPLLGSYPHIRSDRKNQIEKHLAAAFYPVYGFGYGRSHAYRQAAVQGSIFKLVTAYEALLQKYQNRQGYEDLNPLTMNDRVYRENDQWYIGETTSGKPIPRKYRGGTLPRSLNKNIGQIDIVRAIETSSNSYFGLLAGDHLNHPNDLNRAAANFSFGSKTGIDLPSEVAGNLPSDLETNKTGLYSYSIGQHSLVVTPLQTAVMLSAIANGGKVLKPKLVYLRAGSEYDDEVTPLSPKENYPYKESLDRIGIHFPLFTKNISTDAKHNVITEPTEVVRKVSMPYAVQKPLLKGLEGLMEKLTGDGFWSIAHRYRDYPEGPRAMKRLKGELIGKSSSGELMEVLNLDKDKGVEKSTHIWFGGISYKDEEREKPELVVVVYLRFGNYGKEAAPLAAQLVEKWREIQSQVKILGADPSIK